MPENSEVSSMVLQCHFEGPCSICWNTQSENPGHDRIDAIRKVSDLDFCAFIQRLPARSLAVRDTVREGELGFWAVCLSAGTISVKARSNSNIWSVKFPIMPFESGSFRFDDGQCRRISEFVGILWIGKGGKGSMVVMGVDTDYDGVSKRVGIGTLQFEEVGPWSRWNWRSMPWQWQFIRLR